MITESCSLMQNVQVGLTVALVAGAYVYFGLYIWYVYGAYMALRAEPYSKYKCGAHMSFCLLSILVVDRYCCQERSVLYL